MDTKDKTHDIVANYPKEISDYQHVNGKLPEEFDYERGVFCVWNKKRFFIHVRAVLPLKALENGVGFGLWVEITKKDFSKYAESLENDGLYRNIKIEGKLANEWPGFESMFGSRVTARCVKLEDKLYITEVHDVNDVTFEIAIRTPAEDADGIEKIRNLVEAYVSDPEYNQPF